MSGEVELGVRIFLDDALSQGMYAMRNSIFSVMSAMQSSAGAASSFTDQIASLTLKAQTAGQIASGFGDAVAKVTSTLDGNTASSAALKDEYDALYMRQVEIVGILEQYELRNNNVIDGVTYLKKDINALTQEYGTNNQRIVENEAARAKLLSTMQKERDQIVALQAKQDAAAASQAALTAETDAATAAQAEAEAQTASLAASLNALGVALGAGVDLTLFIGGLRDAITQAGTLQDALVGVRIALNLTDQQMGIVGDSITQIADRSVFSTTEVAQGFQMLGERGWNVDQIVQHLGQSSVVLAEAIGSQTTPAADLLGRTMQVYGASADQAKQYTDALTFAFYNGIPSVSDLSTAIDQTAEVAKQTNMPIDELVSTLDYLTQNGLKASDAATSLRYMMQALIDPTSKTLKQMEDLGIITANRATPAFQQFAAQLAASGSAGRKAVGDFDGTISSLNDLFNVGQKAGTIPLDKNFLDWALSIGMLNDKLYNSKGQFNDWFANLQLIGQSLKGKTKEEFDTALGNLFNVRSGKGGGLLLGDIQNVMSNLDQLKGKMNTFDKQGGAFKDAALQTDTWNGSLKRLSTTISSNFANIGTPITNALKPLVDWMNNLFSTTSKGGSTVSTFGATFLTVGTILSGVTVVVALLAAASLALGVSMLPIIGIAFGVALAIAAISAVVALVVANWSRIVGFFSGVWDAVRNGVGNFFNWLGATVHNSLGPIGGFFTNIGNAIRTGIGAAFSWLGTQIQNVVGFFGNIFGAIGNFLGWGGEMLILTHALGQGWKSVTDSLGWFGNQMQSVVGPAFASIKPLWDGLVSAFKNMHSAAQPVIDAFNHVVAGFAPMHNGLDAVGKAAKGMGEAWNNSGIGTALKTIGMALLDIIVGPFQRFVQSIQAVVQLVQAHWSQISGAFEAVFNVVKTTLLTFSAVLGGIIAGVISLIVGLFNGLLHAIVPIIMMIVGVVKGFIQVVTGIVQIFQGVFNIIHGIFTLNGKMIQDGFGQMGQGIISIFVGLWNMIKSLWIGGFTAVLAFVSAFVAGVINFFIGLVKSLGGHVSQGVQNVADILNNLPTLAWNTFKSFLHSILGALGDFGGWVHTNIVQRFLDSITNLITQMPTLGGNILKSLAQGIISGISSFLGNAMGAVGNFIHDHLPHSPAKMGPLRFLHEQGAEIPNQIALGIHSNVGVLGSAATRMGNLLTPQTFGRPSSLVGAGAGGAGLNGATTVVNFNMDGKVIAQGVIDHATNTLKMNGMGRTLK